MDQIESQVFSDAVREFWQVRNRQAGAQIQRGGSDQGGRGAVTGGQQMNGFAQKISELMGRVGVKESDIHSRRGLADLPGFYRPTKEWDIVVVVNGELLAAVELKSQVGPSFGNNFNNRTEEAMGSALDLWTAYREGALRASSTPWLGYLLVLEDCPQSQRAVAVREPQFPVLDEFRNASYAVRYELFCRKLVRERQYSAACFIVADSQQADRTVNYAEPAEDLSATLFISQLLRHVRDR
ncbi:MAG: restriction endonuclease [Dehalococcoidia bacterium]|nr:restriction endonuclease [Dehalococcoidia bacterium]